jgi:PAS domain S-box-containing protein
MFDLANLQIDEIIKLGNKLRTAGLRKNHLEDVAQELVNTIYDELIIGEKKEKACSLVRFFKTHSYNDLEQGQKDFANILLSKSSNVENVKCLTLLATAGEKPEWNSRAESRGHKAIPLLSEDIVKKLPMISSLYSQMGLDINSVIQPDIKFIESELDKNFSVFYIPDANGSPSIPDQESFIIPYGIKSVIGFGGIYPTGDVFSVILFSKTFISKEIADLFQMLAIYIKIATLPFLSHVFNSQIKISENATPFKTLKSENRVLKVQGEAYENVLSTFEKLVEKTTNQRDMILNSVDQGIYGLDLNGYTTFANAAAERMLGYKLKEMINCSQHDLIHHSKSDGSSYNKSECPIYLAFKEGKTYHAANEVFWKKNGDSFPVEYTSTPILENGVIVGSVVSFKDISDQKEAEKRIAKVQKQLIAAEKLAGVGELAAGVSHEVLNPVNIISVNTQMLQRKMEDDSNIQSFCNKIKHEVDRIQKIMGSLLVFSRKGDAEFEKGDLYEEIEKTLALVEEEYKLDNITIVRNWCGKCTEVRFDADKMRQVYLNLIHNAKHAMQDGGTITVSCRPIKEVGKNFHQYTFSDTGMGMPEEVKLKIFEPFFTTKPEGEGTGMGLAVIHGIIQEHGGKIRVESEEGKGTTFIISLPLA